MANDKKAVFDSPEISHTMVQNEEAQKFSSQLSELQDLKQHPEAPKIKGYLLLKPIGQGAYAQVWEALQVHTRKFVAIKVFTKKSGVHWFFLQREAERLVRLDKHPHIVSLLDADLGGEVPYYVMDLAQEGSLEKLLEREKTHEVEFIGTDRVADWLKEIAQALHYVHTKQMVHCDLKPANVLLDDEGHIRVADFGHSRVLSESGGSLGTLFYMAPEQAVLAEGGEPQLPNVQWDIYALGCTAYALLSGHVPHEEIESWLASTPHLKERLEIYREALASQDIPDLFTATQGRVDRDLSAIVAKCMNTHPTERYHKVEEVLKDLKARKEMKPVSPLAHHPIYWTQKLLTRHWLSAAIALAAAVITLPALFSSSHNQKAQVQDTAFEYVLRGREFLAKGDEASAAAYFAASNKIYPSLLARGNAVRHMPPVPTRLFNYGDGAALAVFSPDGSTLLTYSNQSGARLWDVATGHPHETLLREERTVTAAAFSPTGTSFAIGDSMGEVQVWRLEGQRPLWKILDQEAGISALAFRPDGKILLAADKDGLARLWDIPGGRPIGHSVDLQVKGAPSWYKPNVAFSPDGKIFLTTGWDGGVRFYDLQGRRLGRPLFLKGIGAHAVFSPDGKWILASVLREGTMGSARVWNVEKRKPLKFELRTAGRMTFLAFDPQGERALTASTDNIVRLWDARTGRPLGRAMEHGDEIMAASFDPDGATLATASKGGLGRIWALNGSEDPQYQLRWNDPFRRGYRKGEGHALFSGDGKALFTYGGRSVGVWDAVTGRPVGPVLQTLGTVLRVIPNQKGSLLLACENGKGAELWTVGTERAILLPTLGPVQGGGFTPDEKKVLTASAAGELQFWDTTTGRPLGTSFSTGSKVQRVFVDPSGKWIAVLSSGGKMRLYSAALRSPKPAVEWEGGIRNVAFSPDGKRLVAIGGTDAVVWEPSSGKSLVTLHHRHTLASALFSSDGETVATLGLDGTASLWRTATGEPVGNPLGRFGPIVASTVSPRGNVLVLAYLDGHWQPWDMATGETIGGESLVGKPVLAMGFLGDGKSLGLVDKEGALVRADFSWMDPATNADKLLLASEAAGLRRVTEKGALEDLSTDKWIRVWREYREGKP